MGGADPELDLDESGLVDFADLLLILANWGCGEMTPSELPPDIIDCLNATSDPARQLDCIEGIVQTTGVGGGS